VCECASVLHFRGWARGSVGVEGRAQVMDIHTHTHIYIYMVKHARWGVTSRNGEALSRTL
jgi:hypothetical protein